MIDFWGDPSHRTLGLSTALGLSTGKLDRPLELSAGGTPALLGVLDLAVELGSRSRLFRPAIATVDVSWVFSPHRATVSLQSDIRVDAVTRTRLSASFGLEARNLKPGLIGFQDWLTPEPCAVSGRKGVKYRPVTLSLRLLLLDSARPIGSVPLVDNGMFQPVQA